MEVGIDTIIQLIGSLGFPIVACVMLYIRMEKQDQTHREEVSELTKAIQNNTLVMQQLVDKMGD